MSKAQPFVDADVTVEALLYVPGLAAADSPPDVLVEDFVFHFDEVRKGHQLHKAAPWLVKCLSEGGGDKSTAEDICEIASEGRRVGFLVKVSTDEREYSSEKAWASGFAGSYYDWLYAKDEADIAVVAIAWAEGRHAVDLAKFKAKPVAKAAPQPDDKHPF